ncbi:hypothetical protein [Solimonas fluminis]|nr:hypothetical protein [Solimonas fluminis]
MTRPLLIALAALTLTACASRPAMQGRNPGIASEKEIVVTLAKVEATAEQRAKVLAAFDAALPQTRALQAERETLRQQLQGLSPRQPDYLERSAALAKQWGELHEREVLAYARFESAVATTLSDSQWEQWQDQAVLMAPIERGPGAGGQMRRRR